MGMADTVTTDQVLAELIQLRHAVVCTGLAVLHAGGKAPYGTDPDGLWRELWALRVNFDPEL